MTSKPEGIHMDDKRASCPVDDPGTPSSVRYADFSDKWIGGRGIRTLILLAVPMLFGFSERALTFLEERVFGKTTTSRNRVC